MPEAKAKAADGLTIDIDKPVTVKAGGKSMTAHWQEGKVQSRRPNNWDEPIAGFVLVLDEGGA